MSTDTMQNTPDQRAPQTIRLRAGLIGILLATGICLLTPYNNI